MIKFADILDELIDGGPCFSVDKPIAFGSPGSESSDQELLEFVRSVVGDVAADQYESTLHSNAEFDPPQPLKTPDRSFHSVSIGVDQLRRGRVQQRIHKLLRKRRKSATKVA